MEDAEITVSANYFGGTFVEAERPFRRSRIIDFDPQHYTTYHNPDLQTEGADNGRAPFILPFKLNTVYSFDADDLIFTVDYTGNEPQGGTDKGTYEWTPVYGTLILHYDDGRTDSS